MQSFDLVIIGTGSGNSIPEELGDKRIALVERDVFGGTCLNKGCIPSKIFVYTADVAQTIRHAATYGIDAQINGIDWPSIVERVFGRIDPIAAGGEDYRTNQCENITVFRGSGRFVGDRVLEVNGEQITGEQFLLAAGARPVVPDIEGLVDVGYYTSDDVMRLPELPKRMIIVGGGYIASELGHVFDAMGTEVTFVIRGGAMLRAQDDEISARVTEVYGRRFDIKTNTDGLAFSKDAGGITLTGNSEGDAFTCTADVVLVAAGRTPNGDDLNVEATGVETNGRGRVLSNDSLETNVPGIWALGDITNELQLKHLANLEGKIAFHNLQHPEDRRTIDRTLVPAAVFGNPQIASVGLTERAAKEQGLDYIVSRQDYGGTAYGWAMEDHDSFAKLIADRQTRKLIGAHIIGPQASILIQQLIQGMRFGQTVDEMGEEVWYIHPALTEVIENCLLNFEPPSV